MAVNDPFNLERFVTAQASIFETALSELKAGRKRSHWMWFVFPQLRGLGHSSNAAFYGIGSLAEVYDGDEPRRPNGCIAQAWSVAETLRALLNLGG